MEKSNRIPAENAAPPTAPSEHVKASFGERAFNWLTYGAWNHGVNLLLSTVIAYAFAGSKANKWCLEKLKKTGISDSAAEMVTGITVLSTGGHITALGVKPLEDRKADHVQKINQRFSPQEVDAPLHDDRKQTWMSVIGARIFTLTVAIVSFSGLKGLLGNNTEGKPRIDAFQERVGRWFAKASKTTEDVSHLPRFKLGKILALEVVIVTAMSTLFYFSSKLLSKKEPQLLPAKVKPKIETGNTAADAEVEQPKTNFAERVREQESAESLGVARA